MFDNNIGQSPKYKIQYKIGTAKRKFVNNYVVEVCKTETTVVKVFLKILKKN